MRTEFSRQVKRAAYERSGGLCEASGPFYGLASVTRCNMPLDRGVEYDHFIADALGGEATLENCLCVCKKCHAIKSHLRDTPLAAKVKRLSDARKGIDKPKGRGWGWSGKFKRKMDGSMVER